MTEHDESVWLPWSCSAEQSVLGALLCDNDAAARITAIVDAASFWHEPHRRIFSAILRLIGCGQPADVITVFEALRDGGHAEGDCGMAYLNQLAQCVPSASNIREYGKIVADKALRRALLAAIDKVPDLIKGAESADVALDRVQTLVGGVKRLKASGDPRAIGELMLARTAHWEALGDGTEASGIPTGLGSLDEALGGGIKPGKVIVLAARPSVGKTSLATQILLHVAGQGRPTLMLSQEMTAGELMDRTAAHLGRVGLDRVATGRLDHEDWSRIVEASEAAARLPVYVDDQPALSLLEIRGKARQVQRQASGLALVVVDYLQLCSSAAGMEKRHHQIEQISRGLKTLAKELNICILLLSQLNRASEGGEPELQHLKESGSIEEDADVVLMLSPVSNEPDGTLQVLAKVAKNRGGKRGRLTLSFNGGTQTWVESSRNVARRSSGGAP